MNEDKVAQLEPLWTEETVACDQLADPVSLGQASLPKEARLAELASDIRTRMKRSAIDIYHIGADLLEASTILSHGEFLRWVDAEFSMSQRTAYRFLDVAKAFQDKFAKLANFDIAASALYLLAAPSTPNDARSEALDLAANGETITPNKAKSIVNRHKQHNCLASVASLAQDSPTISNSDETAASDPDRTCWNCQHRGELIENHSFYCNRLGVFNLLDKGADTRGAECDLWSYQGTNSEENKNQPFPTFTLTLPAHLQPLVQDSARTTGMSVVDWATWVLESEALDACSPSRCT
jgi:hypothetical protein